MNTMTGELNFIVFFVSIALIVFKPWTVSVETVRKRRNARMPQCSSSHQPLLWAFSMVLAPIT